MQENPGSSWQFLYSAGLLSALICVLGSSPLQLCQHNVVCSLCKKSGNLWKWKKGDSVALCMNYLCVGELLLLIRWGFLPHFSFFVFVWYLLLHDFFSFSLSPCTSSFFPFRCICISLAHFLSFLSFSLLLPFLELVTFSPAFRNICPLSLYFLTCFIRVFFLLFFLNCFSSFFLCLTCSVLLYSVLLPSPSFLNPLSIIPHLWLQVLQLQESETLPERGEAPYVSLPPWKRGEEGASCLGTMVLVNKM